MDNIPAEFFDDAPGELDLFARGDMRKAEYAHRRGDPKALSETVIHCLENGVPVPAWAVPSAIQVMEKDMKASRVNPRVQAAYAARAAALHVADGDAKLTESLLLSERVTKELKERGITISTLDREALKDWWTEKNQRKHEEPEYALMAIFYRELDRK